MVVGRWISILALVALASCTKESEPGDSAAALPVGPDAGAPPPVVAYNIGDVETAIRITAQLADKSKADNVLYHELETKKGDLAMAEATVGAPYPDELWIHSKVSTPRGFRAGDAILVRQKIYVEGRTEPIAQQAFVWSGSAALQEPKALDVDLVPWLGPISGSVLVHARAEIVWYPDTDPSSIDPAAPTEPSKVPVERLSNSLRISFS